MRRASDLRFGTGTLGHDAPGTPVVVRCRKRVPDPYRSSNGVDEIGKAPPVITISVADASTRLPEIIAHVEAGHEITITSDVRPVVRIVAVGSTDAISRSEAVDTIFRNLAELGRGVRLDGDLKRIARSGSD
jgi:prevent-host-death family protein